MQLQTGISVGQGVMQQPPEIVTTKDLSYIEDALSWELLAAKKFAMYAQMAQEQGSRISVIDWQNAPEPLPDALKAFGSCQGHAQSAHATVNREVKSCQTIRTSSKTLNPGLYLL